MEHFLKLQISELVASIVGLDAVKKFCDIHDFKPIEDLNQARWAIRQVGDAARGVRLHAANCEQICQAIVDYNNETGWAEKNRPAGQFRRERLEIARALGHKTETMIGGALVGASIGEEV